MCFLILSTELPYNKNFNKIGEKVKAKLLKLIQETNEECNAGPYEDAELVTMFEVAKRVIKIFADDKSLFSKAINRKKSEIEPNKDLRLISQWAYQWKMLFNPNPTKQATEVCFSHKRNNIPREPLTFNNNKIQSRPAEKHFGLILDSKLHFNQHKDDKINKCDKIIRIIKRKRLSMIITRKSLLTIYNILLDHFWIMEIFSMIRHVISRSNKNLN